jgi:hypothetical protein
VAGENPEALFCAGPSIVVQDRAEAAALGESRRVGTVAEQVEAERVVGLLLVVAVDDDGDGLRRFPTSLDGQRH